MKKLVLSLCLLFSVSSFAQDPETIVFSFQKQKRPEDLQMAATQIAEVLAKEIGKKVEILVPTSYGSTVQGFISKKVHVAYMDSLPYILAKKETAVEIIAVEKRNGKTNYDSLLVVKKGSSIKTLADLKAKTIAFTSQTSTSGYLMPYSRLVNEKVLKNAGELNQFFANTIYAGGYDKALQAVIKGQADVAAFSDYVIEGKKADLYGTQADRDQVQVLTRTSGVPTHLIAVAGGLSADLKKKIQNALLKISKEKPELLSSVYGAAEIVVPQNPEAHVARTVQALMETGLDVKAFVK